MASLRKNSRRDNSRECTEMPLVQKLREIRNSCHDNSRERKNTEMPLVQKLRETRNSRRDNSRERKNTEMPLVQKLRNRNSRRDNSRERKNTEMPLVQKLRQNRNSRRDNSRERKNTQMPLIQNLREIRNSRRDKSRERKNTEMPRIQNLREIRNSRRDKSREHINIVVHDNNRQRKQEVMNSVYCDDGLANVETRNRKRRPAMETPQVTPHKRQRTVAYTTKSESVQSLGSQSRKTLIKNRSVILEKHTAGTKITYTETNETKYLCKNPIGSRILSGDERLLSRSDTVPGSRKDQVSGSDWETDNDTYIGHGLDYQSGGNRFESRSGRSVTVHPNHRLDLDDTSDSEPESVPFKRMKRCYGNLVSTSDTDNYSDNNNDFAIRGHGWGRNVYSSETSTMQRDEIVWLHDDNEDSGDASDLDAEVFMAGRKNLNKNAISAFEEYGVQQRKPPKVEVVSTSGPPHKPLFKAVAKLGQEEVCCEHGHSKHEARIKAAERALQMLSVQEVGAAGDTELSEIQSLEGSDEDISNPVPYKDPVSALMEFAQFAKQDVSFDLISQEGPPHMPLFTMAVKLGDELCPSVKGGSAKDTKKRAACMALHKLKRQGALQTLFPDTKATAVPVGKLKSKSTLGAPGKNPVSVLNEYAQKSSTRLRFESSQTGPPHKPVFSVWAVLGEENFPAVTAASKKEGNVQAAETVLKVLGERGHYVMPKAILGQLTSTNSTTHNPLSQHDRVAAAAVRKFDELLLQTPESLVGRKVIAAIVMMDEEQGLYRVVSLGSGNRCVKGSHISHDGTVLHDSHAEVLARRGFKRFLYWLQKTKDLPILVRGRHGKYRFKDGISFHLYISIAPCGDGALFTHSDRGVEGSSCPGSEHSPVFTNTRTQGLLRAKQENGEGTIPVEPEFVGQTYDGIQQGGRLRVMSCSDKICQWNVVGLQGALLSGLYEPVYLRSITLGNLFNAGHLARAMCCRIDYGLVQLQSKLPAGYHVNHPDLGVTSCQDATRVVEKARSLSINWCFGDKYPEITDGTIGKTVKTVDKIEGPSRLCKKALFDLYRHTVSDKSLTNVSYKQVKLDADDYNQAKLALHKRLKEKNYGDWVCMPREVDRFQ